MFKNYLIAREKYRPDYFLYENNKSMSSAIRDQITKEFGVEPILINSALVSAQNRQRLYWVGKREADGTYSRVDVQQPEDKGILLRDILESVLDEKGYELAEPKPLSDKEMDYMVRKTKDGRNHFDFDYFHDGNKDKSSCLTANIYKGVPYNVIAEPVREGKSVTVGACGGDTKSGLYAVPVSIDVAGKVYPVYEVKDCQITIKDKQHPIKLADGFYIIRKLTVRECMRLQQVPEDYIFPVSNTQSYKMLGNGWSCDVIAHILSYCTGLQKDKVEVLSMYDGMSCGHIALNKLGIDVAAYYATEIDKYAIKTTQTNYPDTIQLGDAFQVREDNWSWG